MKTRALSRTLLVGSLIVAASLLIEGSAAAQETSWYDAQASFDEPLPPPPPIGLLRQVNPGELCKQIRMDVHASTAGAVSVGMSILNFCGKTIDLAAEDIGTATGSATALDDDALRVAPTLSAAWLVTTVPLCDIEHQIGFVPPGQRECPDPATTPLRVSIDLRWTATGPLTPTSEGRLCRAARADATITALWRVALDGPGSMADLTTESARLCGPASDTTLPTLVLPPTVVVDGTSPAGATVTYSVSASDDTDPNPMVVCTPPSGSVFPLMATTVSCTATDAAGNSATETFQVVVLDARQQLQEAADLIASYNLRRLGTSLPDKLQLASDFAAAGDVIQACGVMTGLLNQVRAQTDKALTVEQATELIMEGIRIRNVIGC